MTKGNSDNTMNRILQVAEELFSEKGFNGTSVNMIAEKAEVNKALIYYYFKNKNDIIISLFNKLLKESEEYIGRTKDHNHSEAIKKEILFWSKRKKMLSVMLMESLKGDHKDNFILQIAENVFKHELNDSEKGKSLDMHYLVHEFFTGFMPIIAFIVFQDKWCEYYQYDPGKLMELFLDSFKKAHLDSNEFGKL
jgi:AcrR family transcriptional regulator